MWQNKNKALFFDEQATMKERKLNYTLPKEGAP